MPHTYPENCIHKIEPGIYCRQCDCMKVTAEPHTEEWEKEFDMREEKIWQFAGQHPNFRHHTCEMVKDFIRTLRSQALEEGRKNALLEWKHLSVTAIAAENSSVFEYIEQLERQLALPQEDDR